MSRLKKNTERRKTSFLKELVEKCRPTQSRVKQNNDRTRVVRQIRFRSVTRRTKDIFRTLSTIYDGAFLRKE